MRIAGKKISTGTIAVYLTVIVVTIIMLLPFAWMLSASLKLSRDVFAFPIEWIPSQPRWENYVDIWTKIPLALFIYNTSKLTIIVTVLQLLTSSFAAYAFAKLHFPYKNTLFLGYIATIAMPWQVYMVPQFLLMREFGLNNTHLALICLQAFTAFGVFLMRQFYMSIPTELCEAARIDGMNEYQIWAKIKAGAFDPHHLHLRHHLERFPGADDLSHSHGTEDDPDRPSHVHLAIFG
jgi:multiple sugar transport system permease protein